jgi:hypothetical protein
MLLVARMTATSTIDCKDDGNLRTFLRCIARNDNKKWLIAKKEHGIVPSNNQPYLYVKLREQAMIVEQQHWLCNDDALRPVARGYNDGDEG